MGLENPTIQKKNIRIKNHLRCYMHDWRVLVGEQCGNIYFPDDINNMLFSSVWHHLKQLDWSYGCLYLFFSFAYDSINA